MLSITHIHVGMHAACEDGHTQAGVCLASVMHAKAASNESQPDYYLGLSSGVNRMELIDRIIAAAGGLTLLRTDADNGRRASTGFCEVACICRLSSSIWNVSAKSPAVLCRSFRHPTRWTVSSPKSNLAFCLAVVTLTRSSLRRPSRYPQYSPSRRSTLHTSTYLGASLYSCAHCLLTISIISSRLPSGTFLSPSTLPDLPRSLSHCLREPLPTI